MEIIDTDIGIQQNNTTEYFFPLATNAHVKDTRSQTLQTSLAI